MSNLSSSTSSLHCDEKVDWENFELKCDNRDLNHEVCDLAAEVVIQADLLNRTLPLLEEANANWTHFQTAYWEARRELSDQQELLEAAYERLNAVERALRRERKQNRRVAKSPATNQTPCARSPATPHKPTKRTSGPDAGVNTKLRRALVCSARQSPY